MVKQGKKTETTGTLKKKVTELRKKVKSLAQEASNCDSEIHKLQVGAFIARSGFILLHYQFISS